MPSRASFRQKRVFVERFRWRVRSWRQLLANRGTWAAVRAAGSAMAGVWRRRILRRDGLDGPVPAELWRSPGLLPLERHPFDVRYGTETSGLIWGEALPSGHASDPWNTAYYGTAPSIFAQAMARVRELEVLEPGRWTFVDLGSGKGRAVLLASLEPFARVVGVELVPRLHAVAEGNVGRFRAAAAGLREPVCPEIDLVQADAGGFPWAAELQAKGSACLSGALLLFLYNPFARPVLRALLRAVHGEMVQGRLREVVFVYVNPELDAEFARQRWMTRLCRETVPLGAEDRLADRFGSTEETFAVYRCALQFAAAGTGGRKAVV